MSQKSLYLKNQIVQPNHNQIFEKCNLTHKDFFFFNKHLLKCTVCQALSLTQEFCRVRPDFHTTGFHSRFNFSCKS